MDRFDRIYALHRLLRQSRRPVSGRVLMEKMECSRATLFRAIEDLRDRLGAPLVYDRGGGGYFYDSRHGTHQYELPGLWFTASELSALLAIHHLLIDIQPGLLEDHLAPLRDRIKELLRTEHLGGGELLLRIRIPPMAARPTSKYFASLADTLFRRRRLRITYHGRARDDITERTVSPQRLIYYRGNWYLDAWCHAREALRSFAVDRVRSCQPLDEAALDIGETELNEYFATSYGIFAGKPKHIAVLRFSAPAARWVADERWHSDQQGTWLEDGSYELRIPYGDPRELIMDILKYGAEVEVTAPDHLRKEVAGQLKKAAQKYA
jgi:predicted DNA-binding transcriptional regulator YafY